jgi:DNA polymerase
VIDIAIVGEAWGEPEEQQRMPFMGAAGRELTRMLEEAGIERNRCFLTNVFNFRPKPSSDITNLCGGKKEGIEGKAPLKPGAYVLKQYESELVRLYDELDTVKPNLVIALGNTATWALLDNSGISKIRGTVTQTIINDRPQKVLCTYHPAAVLRDWSLRPVTVLDFCKAERESKRPEIVRPTRTIIIDPTLDEIEAFYNEHLVRAEMISFDIETRNDQITCVGFAPNDKIALVIPFYDNRKHGNHFWPTLNDELKAWYWVRKILTLPAMKLAQNGQYDLFFLWYQYRIHVENFAHDTMLLHHALHPESDKGLGFLGSVYTNEAAWKIMRSKTIKRDA